MSVSATCELSFGKQPVTPYANVISAPVIVTIHIKMGVAVAVCGIKTENFPVPNLDLAVIVVVNLRKLEVPI
jgi:hypothetical protein